MRQKAIFKDSSSIKAFKPMPELVYFRGKTYLKLVKELDGKS